MIRNFHTRVKWTCEYGAAPSASSNPKWNARGGQVSALSPKDESNGEALAVKRRRIIGGLSLVLITLLLFCPTTSAQKLELGGGYTHINAFRRSAVWSHPSEYNN